MSRSGYIEGNDKNDWSYIKWRYQVINAICGKPGQAFLRELIVALDALPEKRLIAGDLQKETQPRFIPPDLVNPTPPAVCAIGSVGLRRGVDMLTLDPEDCDAIADTFGIAHQLVREIEYMNDERGSYDETPEDRWERMRRWAEGKVIKVDSP